MPDHCTDAGLNVNSTQGSPQGLSRRTLLGGALGVACATGLPFSNAEALPFAQNDPKDEPKLVAQPSRVRFRKQVINAGSDFEAAGAADIDGDGKIDIISGDTWYKAPHWEPHKFRELSVWGRDANHSGYRGSFADLPVDVNGDGRMDIVSSDYATGEIFWHENVGDTKDLWPRHLIAKPGSAETTFLAPILKDKICVLPNVVSTIVWYELRTAGSTPQWIEHPVGKQGAGHGVGWGDVNGDGKIDIITPSGWWENVDAVNDKWVWHGDYQCKPGDCSVLMLALDVDGDKRNDIIWGSGHNYGLYWLQQQPEGSSEKWVRHVIDKSWSQAHCLQLVNLERKNGPVILTGKRLKAHDDDPGATDPLGIYYYRFDRKKKEWQKYVIDEGSQAGAGLNFAVADMKKRGRLDIIAPGKSGLYLFEQV